MQRQQVKSPPAWHPQDAGADGPFAVRSPAKAGAQTCAGPMEQPGHEDEGLCQARPSVTPAPLLLPTSSPSLQPGPACAVNLGLRGLGGSGRRFLLHRPGAPLGLITLITLPVPQDKWTVCHLLS